MSSSSNTQNKRPSRQTPEPKAGDRQSPCAVKNTCLSGLIAPLRQLDQRLQQTIEVVQLFQGTAFQGCLMGGILPAEQPANVMVEGSALHRLSQTFGLSAFDVGVVVMAIAPELDRRYERLYARLQGGVSASVRKPSIRLALNVLCQDRADRLSQLARFTADSPLLQLLQPIEAHLEASSKASSRASSKGSEGHSTAQTLQLNPLVSHYLLGHRQLNVRFASFCEWVCEPRWSTSASRLSPELTAQLKEASAVVPLSVQLRGNETLSRSLIVEKTAAIAAALRAPLLRVNLTQLASVAHQSEYQSLALIEQVMLQGQLWNAVLSVESGPNSSTSLSQMMHPSLTKLLSEKLSSYPGVTIVTNDDFYPTRPVPQRTVIVPLNSPESGTRLPAQQNRALSHDRPDIGLVQRASAEIEKFRRLLIASSPGLSD